MGKFVHKILPFESYETEKIQAWLNHQAERNLVFMNCANVLATFEREETTELRYVLRTEPGEGLERVDSLTSGIDIYAYPAGQGYIEKQEDPGLAAAVYRKKNQNIIFGVVLLALSGFAALVAVGVCCLSAGIFSMILEGYFFYLVSTVGFVFFGGLYGGYKLIKAVVFQPDRNRTKKGGAGYVFRTVIPVAAAGFLIWWGFNMLAGGGVIHGQPISLDPEEYHVLVPMPLPEDLCPEEWETVLRAIEKKDYSEERFGGVEMFCSADRYSNVPFTNEAIHIYVDDPYGKWTEEGGYQTDFFYRLTYYDLKAAFLAEGYLKEQSSDSTGGRYKAVDLRAAGIEEGRYRRDGDREELLLRNGGKFYRIIYEGSGNLMETMEAREGVSVNRREN